MKYLTKESGYQSIDQILWFNIETEPIEKDLTADSPSFPAWAQKVQHDLSIHDNEDALNRYELRAGLYKEFSFIRSISYGRCIDGVFKVKEIRKDSEKELLEEFFSDVQKFVDNGVKFLGGFSAITFSVPFVAFRAVVNDIDVIQSFDVAGLKPWAIKHVIDVQELLRGTSLTNISVLGACAAFNIPAPEENDLTESNLTVANLFCKYTRRPFVTMSKVTIAEIKELPLLERLYNTRVFSEQVQQELKKLLKKPLKKDREQLKKIIIAHYLEKIDVMDRDDIKKEKVATNEKRITEINQFIDNL